MKERKRTGASVFARHPGAGRDPAARRMKLRKRIALALARHQPRASKSFGDLAALR